MSDKPKKYFSVMREGVAEKLAQRQQELRKKSGLPHPDYYKEFGKSYDIKDDSERMAHQSSLKKKYGVKEEVEMLDEMPESSMKTRDVHAHLKKSGWTLARTGGGHDVYSHPKSKQHIAVPRHKQLKAPLIRGIMKASRVSEETEIEEQLEKKGRFVSGPPKKTFKAPTIVSPIKEAKDAREYDYEGDMAMSQLRSLIFNAEDMMDLMDENTNLPEWVQSKVTLAEDYISTAANYLRGELTEEVKLNEGRPSQRHPLEGHEYHKKSDEALIHIAKDAHAAAEAMKGHNTQAENKYRDQANDSATVRHFRKKSGMPDWYKKKYGHMNEDVKVGDKVSFDHPMSAVPGKTIKKVGTVHKVDGDTAHVKVKDKYGVMTHKKSASELRKENVEIVEASKTIVTQNGHNLATHNPDGTKKEIRGYDVNRKPIYKTHSGLSFRKFAVKSDGTQGPELHVGTNVPKSQPHPFSSQGVYTKGKHTYEEVQLEEAEYLEEKNVPTNPSLWSKAKSMARSKFDVYPSAYANGWAAKWYKSKGGGWKSVNEETSDEPSMAARTLSRKAQIVRDTAKNRKNEKDEASDKFQKEPELSSDIQKAP